MRIVADLSSVAAIEAGFEGAEPSRPLVPGTLEFIPEGVRIGASYIGNPAGTVPNEKLVQWWLNLEPKVFPYYTGPKRMSMRYRFRVEADYATGAYFKGGKWPGMEGTYTLWSESVRPPDPRPSAFATWEGRLFDRYIAASDDWELGIYYYGVRAPRQFIGLDGNLTIKWFPGAVTSDVPGTPASIGKYYGNGTNGGVPLTNVRLKPGVWYDIEQQVVMNSVKDTALFIGGGYPIPQEALELCLANANEDGVLRVLVDGVLCYESRAVAFRGLECVGIQSGDVNTYDGGHANNGVGFPIGPMHFAFGSLVLTDEFDAGGGGTVPEPGKPTQAEKDAILAKLDHATADIEVARAAIVTWPVGTTPPPPTQSIESFTATPPNLASGGGTTNLAWLTSNAATVLLEGQPVPLDGNVDQTVTTTKTYVLTATGPAVPPVTQSLTVNVMIAPGLDPLDTLLAEMDPGEWRVMDPRPAGMDDALTDPNGTNVRNIIAYCGAQSYDAVTSEAWGTGMDHQSSGICRFWRYKLATNAFLPSVNTKGSHGYQHQVTDTLTAKRYCILIGTDRMVEIAPDGTQTLAVDLPFATHNGLIATAGVFAFGRVLWYDANTQTVWAWTPGSGTAKNNWSVFAAVGSPYAGLYHQVAAVAMEGVVLGGGNGGNTPANPANPAKPLNTKLFLLKSDKTVTPLPDAPLHVGVFSGMQLCGDGDGKAIITGGGQCWRYDSTTSLVRQPDPPAGMLDSTTGASVTSVALWDRGASITLTYSSAANPKAQMYVRKA